MIVDSRSVTKNTIIETDVCIAGAGVAGMTLARELIGRQFRVCLLESGGMKPEKKTQALGSGENIGRTYYSLDTSRPRYLGGSSNRWHISIGDECIGCRMRPLDEIDFEQRDWVPYSGWPFLKSHLDPYYGRAQEVCKINSPTYDVKDWEDSKAPRLPTNIDRVRTVIFKFGSRYPFIKDYPEEIERASNISTLLYANVVDIETDLHARKVTRLRVACLDGTIFWVKARLFILAAGAIENARLLLLSNKIQREGLGNQYDLVGRYFIEHPHIKGSAILVPGSQDIFKSTALYNTIRIISGTPGLGKLCLSEDMLRKENLLNYVAQLVPQIMTYASIYKYYYPDIDLRGLRPLCKNVYRKIKRRLTRTFNTKRIGVFRFDIMSEQTPNPDSRITILENRDSLGLQRVGLDWRLSPHDTESIIRTQEILDEEFRHAGMGYLLFDRNEETTTRQISGGWHHMGTTRMHIDPKMGVVDENCKVHGISNLFITGPSVFPTGGYANPSLTIVAIAIRLADHVKELMRQGKIITVNRILVPE